MTDTEELIEGRLRLALEIVGAVVAKVGCERAGVHILPFNRIFDILAFEDEEEIWIALTHEFSKRNLAYVHISNHDALIINDKGKASLKRFRETYAGTRILAGLYTKGKAQRDVCEGLSDLVERLKNDWPLTTPDHGIFYGGDHVAIQTIRCMQLQRPDQLD